MKRALILLVVLMCLLTLPLCATGESIVDAAYG